MRQEASDGRENKMAAMTELFQDKMRKTSGGLMLFSAKLATGLVFGVTLALVLQELLSGAAQAGAASGAAGGSSMTLSFSLSMVVVCALFLWVAKSWTLMSVLIFDLICILAALSVRFYVMLAPNI
jgi:hypothetical protein